MKANRQRTALYALYGLSIAGILLALGIAFPKLTFGLIDLPGLIFVVGGTFAALLLSHSYRDVRRALSRIRHTLKSPAGDTSADEQRLLHVANAFRNGRIRQAEQIMEQIDHSLLRQGIQWVLDRSPREEVEKLVNWRIQADCQQSLADARLLREMGSFAPALGMLGTLIGLIQMLYGLGDQSLGQMGQTMAFAIVTTLYGLIASNLLLKPLAVKLERRVEREYQQLNVLKEAILMLLDRQHPMMIQESLAALKAQHTVLPPNVTKLRAA